MTMLHIILCGNRRCSLLLPVAAMAAVTGFITSALAVQAASHNAPAPHEIARQDTSAQPSTSQRYFQTKPTRKQILAMKFDDLSALSLEELTELAGIVGVSSVDELLKLLVHTASKTAERLNDAPGVVSVITAREIELFGAQTLEDVLNYVVSVNMATNFLYPEIVNVRGEQSSGLTNKHILFLLNGRPLRETLIAGVYTEILTGFPISAIDRIEVMRGPGSVLYGSGAFTGTVNVITKQSFSTSVAARAGSHDVITASAQAGTLFKTGVGDLKINAAANYHNRSAWSVPYSALGAGNRREDNIFTPWRSALSGVVTLELGGFRAQTLLTEYRANVLGITPVFPTIEHSISSISSDIGYTHQFSEGFSSSLNLTHKHYRSVYESTTNGQDVVLEWTNYYTPFTTPRPNLKIVFGGVANARLGGIVNSTDAAVVVPQYNQLWWSAYAEAQWSLFEELKISAGVQANKPDNIPLDLVPRLNIIWSITPELGIKALYGQAFRAPTAFELFIDGPAAVGNPSLRPQKISTFDIEAFWETSIARLSLVYFNGTQTDVIANGRSGTRSTYVNQGTYLMEGVEFEGKYAPSNELYALGSALLQRNFLNSTIANTSPAPDVTLKLGIGYDNHDGFSASVFYIYTGQLGGLGPSNQNRVVNPIPRPYHQLSANVNLDLTALLNWSAAPRILLNVRAENILNEPMWSPQTTSNVNSLPLAPGRGVYGGIILKL